jgi:hypothetical protein
VGGKEGDAPTRVEDEAAEMLERSEDSGKRPRLLSSSAIAILCLAASGSASALPNYSGGLGEACLRAATKTGGMECEWSHGFRKPRTEGEISRKCHMDRQECWIFQFMSPDEMRRRSFLNPLALMLECRGWKLACISQFTQPSLLLEKDRGAITAKVTSSSKHNTCASFNEDYALRVRQADLLLHLWLEIICDDAISGLSLQRSGADHSGR